MYAPVLASRRLIVAALLLFLSMARPLAAAPPVVAFDETHGEKFLVGSDEKLGLSQLGEILRRGGARVQPLRPPLTGSLDGIDALVVSGAFAAFTPEEVDALVAFVERGGRLAVMLHIPFPLTPLLRRLHVDFANGVIRDPGRSVGGDPMSFTVTTFEPHALTRGLDSISVFGAWALRNEGDQAAIIARSGNDSWIDLNRNDRSDPGDAVQSFGIAVAGAIGRGQFVVFGDDALFQNQFLEGGNRRLATNLACWLTPSVCLPTDRSTKSDSGNPREARRFGALRFTS